MFWISLDFETSGPEGGVATNPDTELVLACWDLHYPDGYVERKHKFGSEFEQKELLEDVAKCSFLVAHNAKYELQWLRRMGVDLRDVYAVCTQVTEWVLEGNKPSGMYCSLESLGGKYKVGSKKSTVSSLISRGVSTNDIPGNWLLEYCQNDVELCSEVWKRQRERLEELHLRHIADSRFNTMRVLADIEFNPLCLDKERVLSERSTLLNELEVVESELAKICRGKLLTSAKQKRELLYDILKFKPPTKYGRPLLTEGGELPTDLDTIKQLKCSNKKQRKFVELMSKFSELNAKLTKSVDFFTAVVNDYDCRFYGKFNQTATSTHRLSSSGRNITVGSKQKGIQLQNIPRVYKKLFKASREGYLIGECDGSQLEFRAAAILSNDKVAIEEISTGADIHSITAEFLTKAGEPTSRQDAKAFTFKPLYGGGYGSPAVVEYCEFFKKKYPQISAMQSDWYYKANNSGKLVTPYGMIYYWPRGNAPRTETYNYPVQGFATAEIIPIALYNLWLLTRGSRIHIVCTIHDSIVCEVHPEEVESFERLCVQAMTHSVFSHLAKKYSFKVTDCPLGTSIKVATHWGDTKKEVSYNVWPDGREERKEK